MAPRVFTLAERPDLAERGIRAESVWPEYNLHGAVTSRLWPRLHADLPQLQFSLCEGGSGEVVAQGRTVPCWWDGTDEGLSSGVDQTLQAAFATLDAGESTNTLCAMAAEIPPRSRGRGLARTILEAMSAIAEAAGLEHVIAPVRPSMKDRYPITPIQRYVTWRRGDGRLFDPGCVFTRRWARVWDRRSRTRWGSPARSASGSLGPGLPSPILGSSSSQKD